MPNQQAQSAQGDWCPLCAVNVDRWIVTRKAKKR